MYVIFRFNPVELLRTFKYIDFWICLAANLMDMPCREQIVIRIRLKMCANNKYCPLIFSKMLSWQFIWCLTVLWFHVQISEKNNWDKLDVEGIEGGYGCCSLPCDAHYRHWRLGRSRILLTRLIRLWLIRRSETHEISRRRRRGPTSSDAVRAVERGSVCEFTFFTRSSPNAKDNVITNIFFCRI